MSKALRSGSMRLDNPFNMSTATQLAAEFRLHDTTALQGTLNAVWVGYLQGLQRINHRDEITRHLNRITPVYAAIGQANRRWGSLRSVDQSELCHSAGVSKREFTTHLEKSAELVGRIKSQLKAAAGNASRARGPYRGRKESSDPAEKDFDLEPFYEAVKPLVPFCEEAFATGYTYRLRERSEQEQAADGERWIADDDCVRFVHKCLQLLRPDIKLTLSTCQTIMRVGIFGRDRR